MEITTPTPSPIDISKDNNNKDNKSLYIITSSIILLTLFIKHKYF